MRPTCARDAAGHSSNFAGLSASALAAAVVLSLALVAPSAMPACVAQPGARSPMDKESTDPAAQEGGGSAATREKRGRTPAQRKIDSQLLYAIYRKRGEAEAKGVPAIEPAVRYDEEGRALVDVRARPLAKVLAKIKSLGGHVVSHLERYDDIRAYVPLEKLEALAAMKEVRAIMPAAEATTN